MQTNFSVFDKFIALFKEYISFKSISTDPAFKDEIQKTVDWLHNLFLENDFKVQFLQGPKTNPVLLAHYHQADDLETVLIYGHYDVQPAENEGWLSDPFQLEIRDERAFGRGVVDNKGQNLIHLVTIFDLIKSGELKYNIKFMLEGNEETGNEDMSDLVKANAELLKADYYLVSDGEIMGDVPTLEASLRGGMNVKLTLKIADKDFHSGLCGGAIPNPILALAEVVSLLKDDWQNYVNIDGFYDGIPEITDEQINNIKKCPGDKEAYATEGVNESVSEFYAGNELSFYGQVGLMPTIEFTGFHGGYTGTGFQNIIPGKAEVRINFRFVHGQDIQQIYQNFHEMLQDSIPSYFDWNVEPTKPYGAVAVDTSSPTVKNVLFLLENAYEKEPVIKYCGAGIPIVLDFKNTLSKDTLLVSLGNNDCNMHGANENFRLDLIVKGLEFSRSFFKK